MRLRKLLIANRGEIAVRIARAAAELGVATVAVFSKDDARSLHRSLADEAVALAGAGPAAYLDAEAMVAAAQGAGCDAVHPGYGFLAENAGFARLCAARGLTFVGPEPETLEALGDKLRARALAEAAGVPVAPATPAAASLEEVRAFARSGPIMIKAVAGGGGRGMRIVPFGEDPASAYEACAREAAAAFGDGRLYAEALVADARHVEVQIAGDGAELAVLGDRECSIQRRRQKLIEVAPAPALSAELRAAWPTPPANWARRPRSAASPPSSSWCGRTSASSSSRPIRACRSSTP
ncbi:MAG: biotin carboxylase [Phenylobacterium sp.]|nr:biotin carboxylase [Phenylobacterium sp.]